MKPGFPVLVCVGVLAYNNVLVPSIVLGDMPQAVQDQVRRVVVDVFATYDTGLEVGSGIVCGQKNGRILIATAYHVVRNLNRTPSRVEVDLRFMPSKRFKADLSPRSDHALDVAVISIQLGERKALGPDMLPVLQIGRIDDLPKKPEVFACGKGGVLESEPDLFSSFKNSRIVFKTRTVTSGFSGGGLFTEQGHLLGMILNHEPPEADAIRIDTLRNWLKGNDIDVSQWEGTQKTPGQILIGAAKRCDLEEVRRAFSLGASPLERDETGMTALHWVVNADSDDEFSHVLGIIDLLLEQGANINALDEDGNTPLHEAMISRLPPSKATTLVTKLTSIPGIDVNRRNSGGETPLHRSVHPVHRVRLDRQGKDTILAILDALLRGGADVKAEDFDGRTALHHAARLFSRGKEIEEIEKIESLQTSILSRLLREPGADPNHRSRNEWACTPLHEAISSQSIRLVNELLRDKRVDISLRCEDGKGISPYAIASLRATDEDEDGNSQEKAKIILKMLEERDE